MLFAINHSFEYQNLWCSFHLFKYYFFSGNRCCSPLIFLCVSKFVMARFIYWDCY